mmetsp:Transcript_17032/g.59686  ORF Transcript_17032/g.59686 Transcript_17032/m.59686 type:complete len:672 (-) Transcript_17032:3331-5346(-)
MQGSRIRSNLAANRPHASPPSSWCAGDRRCGEFLPPGDPGSLSRASSDTTLSEAGRRRRSDLLLRGAACSSSTDIWLMPLSTLASATRCAEKRRSRRRSSAVSADAMFVSSLLFCGLPSLEVRLACAAATPAAACASNDASATPRSTSGDMADDSPPPMEEASGRNGASACAPPRGMRDVSTGSSSAAPRSRMLLARTLMRLSRSCARRVCALLSSSSRRTVATGVACGNGFSIASAMRFSSWNVTRTRCSNASSSAWFLPAALILVLPATSSSASWNDTPRCIVRVLLTPECRLSVGTGTGADAAVAVEPSSALADGCTPTRFVRPLPPPAMKNALATCLDSLRTCAGRGEHPPIKTTARSSTLDAIAGEPLSAAYWSACSMALSATLYLAAAAAPWRWNAPATTPMSTASRMTETTSATTKAAPAAAPVPPACICAHWPSSPRPKSAGSPVPTVTNAGAVGPSARPSATTVAINTPKQRATTASTCVSSIVLDAAMTTGPTSGNTSMALMTRPTRRMNTMDTRKPSASWSVVTLSSAATASAVVSDTSSATPANDDAATASMIVITTSSSADTTWSTTLRLQSSRVTPPARKMRRPMLTMCTAHIAIASSWNATDSVKRLSAYRETCASTAIASAASEKSACSSTVTKAARCGLKTTNSSRAAPKSAGA